MKFCGFDYFLPHPLCPSPARRRGIIFSLSYWHSHHYVAGESWAAVGLFRFNSHQVCGNNGENHSGKRNRVGNNHVDNQRNNNSITGAPALVSGLTISTSTVGAHF